MRFVVRYHNGGAALVDARDRAEAFDTPGANGERVAAVYAPAEVTLTEAWTAGGVVRVEFVVREVG